MIPVRELTTADEVFANAKRLRGVFYGSRQVAPTQVITVPEMASVEQVIAPLTPDEPQGSAPFVHPPLQDLLDNFVLHFSSEDVVRVSLADIINRVATVFRVGVGNMKSERRTVTLMLPRHAFCYLAKEMTGKSFSSIGRFLGGRDHTTILHGAKRCEAIMASDPDYRLMVCSVRSYLEQRA